MECSNSQKFNRDPTLRSAFCHRRQPKDLFIFFLSIVDPRLDQYLASSKLELFDKNCYFRQSSKGRTFRCRSFLLRSSRSPELSEVTGGLIRVDPFRQGYGFLFPGTMRLSKTEINLRRLLAASPRQENQTKLIHYVATLREQLEQLGKETTSEGLPSISKAKLNDYSEKIESLAASLVTPEQSDPNHPIESEDAAVDATNVDQVSTIDQEPVTDNPSPGLRRRHFSQTTSDEKINEISEATQSGHIKLDASSQAHIEKHRNLQEDLTDEMVDLARQLKESTLLMSQSVQKTEKFLDSTERALEHSLASTGRVNTRAAEIYSESMKTSCFTWLLMFAMLFVFVMVVLLIRVT